jgi:hydroxyacylglutathione hydrolase
MPVDIRLVPCLQDNYAVLLRDEESGAVAVIDAPEAAPIIGALDEAGWQLTHILVTHRHDDHVAGIPELRRRYGPVVIVPEEAAGLVGGPPDRVVHEGDEIEVGTLRAEVIDTPGHTNGHISYWFRDDDLLFVGDTLFVMGCGRVTEGKPAVLWESLKKLRALPPRTRAWCGHEYTLSNARFAVKVDPDNAKLKARLAAVERLRAAGQPTMPTTIGEEIETTPFLRADHAEIAETVGMAGRDPAEIFAEIRERKNRG